MRPGRAQAYGWPSEKKLIPAMNRDLVKVERRNPTSKIWNLGVVWIVATWTWPLGCPAWEARHGMAAGRVLEEMLQREVDPR